MRFWVPVALFIGTIQGLVYAYTMKVLPDQMQLLGKGLRLAVLGRWTHYGNAVTGGGFNPGSLSAGLVGIPLWIWDSPFSYEILICAFQSLGLYLIYRAVRDDLSRVEQLALVAFIWLTPWRASFSFLWNPCYLFFVSGLHLFSAVQLSKKTTAVMTFLHLLAIGIAMQIHPSFVVLVFASAYLIMRRQITLNWSGVAAALGVCCASLIPYFITLESEKSLHLEPLVTEASAKQYYYGRGLIEVIPVLKGLFYWPRYTSGIFPNHIFNLVSFDGITNLKIRQIASIIFDVTRFSFGGLTLIVSIAAFVWFFRRLMQAKNDRYRMPEFIDNYMVSMVFATVLACAISPIMFSNWHLLLVMPIANINFIRFLFRGTKNLNFFKGFFAPIPYVFACCIYFFIYNCIAVCIANNRSFSDNIHTHYQDVKTLLVNYLKNQS